MISRGMETALVVIDETDGDFRMRQGNLFD